MAKFINSIKISATLFTLGCVLGFGLGGFISDTVGKKLTISSSNLAAYACWIITGYGYAKWILYVSYSLQGFFGAVAYNCIGEKKYSTTLIDFNAKSLF